MPAATGGLFLDVEESRASNNGNEEEHEGVSGAGAALKAEWWCLRESTGIYAKFGGPAAARLAVVAAKAAATA